MAAAAASAESAEVDGLLLFNGGTMAAEEGEKPRPPAPPCNRPRAVAERYERRHKLGEGFFGDVYAAWDPVGRQVVDVKRLSGRTDKQFGHCDFVREATSLAACHDHPSVVLLVATHADDRRGDAGDRFIVTKYAGPINLRQYMELRHWQGLPFGEDEVCDAMAQLLAGVAWVHGAGALHRDIEPVNVLVGLESRRTMWTCGGPICKSRAAACSKSQMRPKSSSAHQFATDFCRTLTQT